MRLVLAGLLVLAAMAFTGQQAEAESYTPADVIALVEHYSAIYGAPVHYMLYVVSCETGETFDPYKVGDYGLSIGPFQFHRYGVWTSIPKHIFRWYADVWDVRRNIEAGIWAFMNGYGSHWSCA